MNQEYTEAGRGAEGEGGETGDGRGEKGEGRDCVASQLVLHSVFLCFLSVASVY